MRLCRWMAVAQCPGLRPVSVVARVALGCQHGLARECRLGPPSPHCNSLAVLLRAATRSPERAVSCCVRIHSNPTRRVKSLYCPPRPAPLHYRFPARRGLARSNQSRGIYTPCSHLDQYFDILRRPGGLRQSPRQGSEAGGRGQALGQAEAARCSAAEEIRAHASFRDGLPPLLLLRNWWWPSRAALT